MPVVSSFDGDARRIHLDPSVANSTWTPLQVFIEYLEHRRDNHQFRGWEPLVRMVGGEPKGGGKFAPRFLQLLTDRRGVTTKIVLPDTGPYRTVVDGELATDNPDVDPEPFDMSSTTTPVIVDYKPSDTELIVVEQDLGPAVEAALADILVRLNADEELLPDGTWQALESGTTNVLLTKRFDEDQLAGTMSLKEETP